LAFYAVSVPLIKSGAGLVHSFALRLPHLRQASPPEADKLQMVSHRNAPRCKLGILDMPGVHNRIQATTLRPRLIRDVNAEVLTTAIIVQK